MKIKEALFMFWATLRNLPYQRCPLCLNLFIIRNGHFILLNETKVCPNCDKRANFINTIEYGIIYKERQNG